MRIGARARLKVFATIFLPIILFFAIWSSLEDGANFGHTLQGAYAGFMLALMFYIVFYFPIVRKLHIRFQQRQDIIDYQRRMSLEFKYWHKRVATARKFDQKTTEILSQLKADFYRELQRNSENLEYIIQQIRELE